MEELIGKLDTLAGVIGLVTVLLVVSSTIESRHFLGNLWKHFLKSITAMIKT